MNRSIVPLILTVFDILRFFVRIFEKMSIPIFIIQTNKITKIFIRSCLKILRKIWFDCDGLVCSGIVLTKCRYRRTKKSNK